MILNKNDKNLEGKAGVSSCAPKGYQFDSQAGPGLWTQSQVRVLQEAADQCLELTLMFSFSLSLSISFTSS